MELGSALSFLKDRTILITGATGFLAKIFVEKVLRVQPNVKKLFLLLRAEDTTTARQRLNYEVLGKELFTVLKEKYGERWNGLVSERVKVVAGDISLEDLGIKDSNLLDLLWREVDVVVNLAATTNFDERYDVSMKINTLGAKHVLDFAQKCKNLRVLLHVSTAYVSGERKGLILENPHKMGETLNGSCGLDIKREEMIIFETLEMLRAQNASEKSITLAMKDLGIKRAKAYGWPNTYVFTKAMGEMLLGKSRDNVPLVIIRPTIVTSTYKEPFPGWIEGLRTVDSLAVAYGKGNITCFPGDPEIIMDVIPSDMVVNAMIVAMVAHADQQGTESIYHVGSSMSNPVEFKALQKFVYNYFTHHPWINKDGKPILVGEITVLSSVEIFERYMFIHYLIPLKGLEMVNKACCQYFQRVYDETHKKIRVMMRMVELYRPYAFFKGVYDDMNTEKLRRATKEENIETDLFYFDPKIVNWEDYFIKTHFPGVMKYVFKIRN
ncbi:unnamed protein product [Cuscuta epithymum]|uniref:Fatty acyl-CoA reductase n=1 Tax=Cuscuta epithymum TaxID=186058 RepID=A0AAV0FRS2_9ASTE|nr:unnamed protein product [Cuscuta epithymum]